MRAMTRDEFLYRQLKENRSLYLGLAIVYALAAVAAIVLAFFAFRKDGLGGALVFICAGLGLLASGYGSLSQCRSYAAALDEIGPDPTGVDTCQTYSLTTAKLIAGTRMSAKQFLQQFIAYGVVCLMLFAGGIFLIALGITDFNGSERTMLLGLGILLVFGGVLLGILTMKALRNWRGAKSLDAEEQAS